MATPLTRSNVEVLPETERPVTRDPNAGVSVFVPSGQSSVEPTKPRGWKTYGAIAVCLLLLVGVLASWPWLKERFWQSKPLDPVEQVAKSYLDALIRQDKDEAQRLGTVEEPPAISSAGAYYDQVVKQDGRWLFKHRRIDRYIAPGRS